MLRNSYLSISKNKLVRRLYPFLQTICFFSKPLEIDANLFLCCTCLLLIAIEHERTKKEFQDLVTASQENAQGELDRISNLLQESEKARSTSANQISEQSILISQLQHQLLEAKSQLSIAGDGSEQKKEMTRLKAAVESKDRQIKKNEEKIEMQKVEIANLTHKVKSLERGMKQMRDFHGAALPEPSQTSAAPNSVATSTHIEPSSIQSTSDLIDLSLPKPKRTTSRSKRKRREEDLSGRSSTDQESDIEMASLFMEEYLRDSNIQEDSPSTDAPSSPPKRKRSKKVVDDDDTWTPPTVSSSSTSTSTRKGTQNSDHAVATRQSKRNASSTTIIHNAVPESALMPPPPNPIPVLLHGSRSNRYSSSNSLLAPIVNPPSDSDKDLPHPLTPAAPVISSAGDLSHQTGSQLQRPTSAISLQHRVSTSPKPVSSAPSASSDLVSQAPSSSLLPSVSTTTDSDTSPSRTISSALPSNKKTQSSNAESSGAQSTSLLEGLATPSALDYVLQPVDIGWTPLLHPSEIVIGISTLLFDPDTASCALSTSGVTKFAIATLAGRLCRASPSVIADAVFSVLQQHTTSSFAHNHSESSEFFEAATRHGFWQEPLLHLIQSTSAGSFVSTSSRFFETILSKFQHLIHDQKIDDGPLLACLVGFYTSLCRNLNLLCRARFLVFDLLRSRKSALPLSIIAIAHSWPIVIESKPCHVRGYISCSIEALLAHHFSNHPSPILSDKIREKTGWKMLESTSLDKWASLLCSHLRRIICLPPAQSNALSMEKRLSAGLDVIRALELTLGHVDVRIGHFNIWNSFLAPLLSSLPQRALTEASANSISWVNFQATLALMASIALARVQEKDSDLLGSICSTIRSLIGATSPLPFSIELIAFNSLLEILASPSAPTDRVQYVTSLRHWLSSLPTFQRQNVPRHLESLLIPE